MSAYKKNILVGVTVLVALTLLGWMILRFSDAPFRLFAKPQILIRFQSLNAEGLSEGSPISYLGTNIGRVTKITRVRETVQGLPRDVVVIDGTVDATPPLPPANVEGHIRSALIGGGSSILLDMIPPEDAAIPPLQRTDTRPAPGPILPVGTLDGKTILAARYVGTEILPREIGDVASKFGKTNDELQKVLIQIQDEKLVAKLANTVQTIQDKVAQAGHVIEKLDKIIGDEQQGQLQESIANFRETTATAKRIAANLETLSKNANTSLTELSSNGNKLLANGNNLITSTQQRMEDLSKQLMARMEQASKTMDNLESITRKIDQGNGTAALLINNPALYENLLDTSKELKTTISDFNRLVEQWEQEGISFKLGGKN